VSVTDGEYVCLIGPNGAGKTTLLKAISGTVAVDSGSVEFAGRDLQPLPAHERSRLGIIHVPQGRRVFASQTVLENLLLGAYRKEAARRLQESLELAFQLFPVLQQRRHHQAGTLSGGQQQMLAMARGLMGRPRLLMLDEPSLGLAPRIVDEVFERIASLRQVGGMSLLLVEQRAVESIEICERGYVLEGGVVRMSGNRDELLGQESVRRAYLGG
jgi:branched-chain amino acid transport system ATP-binding protein